MRMNNGGNKRRNEGGKGKKRCRMKQRNDGIKDEGWT